LKKSFIDFTNFAQHGDMLHFDPPSLPLSPTSFFTIHAAMRATAAPPSQKKNSAAWGGGKERINHKNQRRLLFFSASSAPSVVFILRGS
jgi:hypothetical protein